MKLKEIWKTNKSDYWIANLCMLLGAGLITARFGEPFYTLPIMAGGGMILSFGMMVGITYFIGDEKE